MAPKPPLFPSPGGRTLRHRCYKRGGGAQRLQPCSQSRPSPIPAPSPHPSPFPGHGLPLPCCHRAALPAGLVRSYPVAVSRDPSFQTPLGGPSGRCGPPVTPTSPHSGLAGSGVSWNESQHCRLLVPEQLQLCRRHLEVMPSIVRAARRTQELCQQSFADMRWNCSSIQRAPSFGPDLLTGKGCCSRRGAAAALPQEHPGLAARSGVSSALDFCFGVNILTLRGANPAQVPSGEGDRR